MTLMTNEQWGFPRDPLDDGENSKESRRERFQRLGKSRMVRILDTIRLVGNLATPNYQWTDKDIAQMRRAIEDTADKTFAKFRKTKQQKPEVNFEFTR